MLSLKVHSNQENQETMKKLMFFGHAYIVAENESKVEEMGKSIKNSRNVGFHHPKHDLEEQFHNYTAAISVLYQ